MRGRGDVAVRHGSDVATRGVVCEFSLKQGRARNFGPRMSIVLFRDREIVGFGTEQIRATLAKRQRFIAGPLSIGLREIVCLNKDLAVEYTGTATNMFDLQTQLLDDEIMQRIWAES